MTDQELIALFHKYRSGDINQLEEAELLKWYSSASLEAFTRIYDLATVDVEGPGEVLFPEMQKRRLENALDATGNAKVLEVRYWWLATAVCLLMSGAYWLITNVQFSQKSGNSLVKEAKHNLADTSVILTLDDGRQLQLDQLAGENIVLPDGSRLSLSGNQLVYDLSNIKGGISKSNRLSTPKGKLFQVILSDGTKVWLNAASSLTYPSLFSDSSRSVQLSGEAYFEVIKSRHTPFYVSLDNGTEVEVLGTAFNVNAYADESTIKTGLVEGKVRVRNGSWFLLLSPGQQASWPNKNSGTASQEFTVEPLEVDQVLAWKNGLFNFNGLDLPAALRQLGRWYHVAIKFEGNIPEGKFKGELDRHLSLDDMIEFLKKTGLHCQLNDGTLIIGEEK